MTTELTGGQQDAKFCRCGRCPPAISRPRDGENAWTTHDVSDDALGADNANMQAVATLARYLDELAAAERDDELVEAILSDGVGVSVDGFWWELGVEKDGWATSRSTLAPALPCASRAQRGSAVRRRRTTHRVGTITWRCSRPPGTEKRQFRP